MLIDTIIDDQVGRKWEIYKKSDNEYYYKYYEYFSSIGWRLTFTDGDEEKGFFTKDCIEWKLEINVI